MAEAAGKSRMPKCARCRNHGYTVNLRGHKGFCPHKTCACDLCELVKERQEVSKRQIKLRRQQRQEEVMGMHVPVPPSIFSQGSICGINLDYLRVVFPRKRVDRLYAVLLHCNNDVNAAAAKLQQEENTGDTGDPRCSVAANNHTAPKMTNKATQWSTDAVPASTTTTTSTTTTSPPHTPKHSRLDATQQPAPQPTDTGEGVGKVVEGNASSTTSTSTSSSSQCLFPYCWPHAVPAQFTPGDCISAPSQDFFLARALSSLRPQIPGTRVPGVSIGSGVLPAPDALPPVVSVLGCGPSPKKGGGGGSGGDGGSSGGVGGGAARAEPTKAAGTIQDCSFDLNSAVTSLPVPLWSLAEMGVSSLQPSTLGTAPLPDGMAAKVSSLAGEALHTTAAAPVCVNWPDVPTSTTPLLPRMSAPFSLPPPPFPGFPPAWPPCSLPPLPYLPSSMPSFFPSCVQFPSPFQASPGSLLSDQSPILPLPLSMEAVVSPAASENDALGSGDVLQDLQITIDKSGNKAGNAHSQANGDIASLNVLGVCGRQSSEDLIDPSGL